VLAHADDRAPWRLLRVGANGPARTIASQHAGPSPRQADIGLDGHGRPIVVWTDGRTLLADVAGHQSVVAVQRQIVLADSRYGRKQLFGDPTRASLAVGPDGAAIVAWESSQPRDSVWIAERPHGANTFGAPRMIGRHDILGWPLVLADERREL